MEPASAALVGTRLLNEVEDGSLEEVLTQLRAITNPPSHPPHDGAARSAPSTSTSTFKLPSYPSSALDDLVHRHFRATQTAPPLAVSGRHLPLLYALVAALVAAPEPKAVVVVDVDWRFDAAALLDWAVPLADDHDARPESAFASASLSTFTSTHAVRLRPTDLDHVYVARPACGSRAHVAAVVASAERFMVYGAHASRAREWWGTVVIGGGQNPLGPPASASASASAAPPVSPAHVHVTAGWKGWLRVDRDQVRGFSAGLSVEEALAQRDRRQAAVDAAGWLADSPWGSFAFGGTATATAVSAGEARDVVSRASPRPCEAGGGA